MNGRLQMDVRESYDSAADAYAEHLFNELEHKPLDRHLLNRFAEAIRGKGDVADLGCGPGHVTRYLSQHGVVAFGIDISPRMVACATRLNPALLFHVGDMSHLDFADRSFAGAISFYSIVHFAPEHLGSVFTEVRRVIADGGLFLVAFHAGEDVVHIDDLWGVKVSLDFRFHQAVAVSKTLTSTGFAVLEWSEREPYDGVEYPSRRSYVLARAT
jgi:SAM-dependent methyltransferase